MLTHNKKAIDSIAERYFAVVNPVKIKIAGMPPTHVMLNKIPKNSDGSQKKRAGLDETKLEETKTEYRQYDVSNEIYVSKKDVQGIKEGQLVCLKGLCDIQKNGDTWLYRGLDPSKRSLVMHWVSANDFVNVTLVLLSDLLNSDKSFNEESMQKVEVVAEKEVEKIKLHQTIQFERVGFFIKDSDDVFIKCD